MRWVFRDAGCHSNWTSLGWTSRFLPATDVCYFPREVTKKWKLHVGYLLLKELVSASGCCGSAAGGRREEDLMLLEKPPQAALYSWSAPRSAAGNVHTQNSQGLWLGFWCCQNCKYGTLSLKRIPGMTVLHYFNFLSFPGSLEVIFRSSTLLLLKSAMLLSSAVFRGWDC